MGMGATSTGVGGKGSAPQTQTGQPGNGLTGAMNAQGNAIATNDAAQQSAYAQARQAALAGQVMERGNQAIPSYAAPYMRSMMQQAQANPQKPLLQAPSNVPLNLSRSMDPTTAAAPSSVASAAMPPSPGFGRGIYGLGRFGGRWGGQDIGRLWGMMNPTASAAAAPAAAPVDTGPPTAMTAMAPGFADGGPVSWTPIKQTAATGIGSLPAVTAVNPAVVAPKPAVVTPVAATTLDQTALNKQLGIPARMTMAGSDITGRMGAMFGAQAKSIVDNWNSLKPEQQTLMGYLQASRNYSDALNAGLKGRYGGGSSYSGGGAGGNYGRSGR